MEIIVRGRHMSVPPRFRQHAAAKLAKLEKLDQKAVRIDVEVSKERNPRQSDRRERVELTILSRGPAIRAEAAADDRYTALDLAFAKLALNGNGVARPRTGELDDQDDLAESDSGMVPIQMEGDGPLVLREKMHAARPMTIDQALLEMELVGHDFYLFHDSECDRFSVVYRRRGYDYGVIRLVEE